MAGYLFGVCSKCCGGCGNCTLSCCLVIQGRNLCEPGNEVVSVTPFIFDEWSSSDGDPAQDPPAAPVANLYDSQWQRVSDSGDYLVIVKTHGCVNGQIALDVEVTKYGPDNVETEYHYRRYANALATLNANGCPVGVTLGEVTDEDVGPDGTGTAPELDLTIDWLCT